jgi:probable addiction module antidote protein
MTMPRSRPYLTGLRERLKDPVYAAEYLNAAERESRDVFLLALRDVVQAHKVSKIAAAAKLNRESLYRALSKQGNPSLSTFNGILKAVGIERQYIVRRIRSRHVKVSGARVSQLEVQIGLGLVQSSTLGHDLADYINRGAEGWDFGRFNAQPFGRSSSPHQVNDETATLVQTLAVAAGQDARSALKEVY